MLTTGSPDWAFAPIQIRLVAKFSEHSEGRIRRWKAPDIKRINWKSTILNGHNKDDKWRTRCETTINLHDLSAHNFSVRPVKPDLSEFSRPGRKPDKYRASRTCSLLGKVPKSWNLDGNGSKMHFPGWESVKMNPKTMMNPMGHLLTLNTSPNKSKSDQNPK